MKTIARTIAQAIARPLAILASVLALAGPSAASAADPTADFFKNNTVRLIVPAGAGGGYSAYSLLIAARLGPLMPGTPSVVVENMPGSGGIKAFNYVANAAPRDGSVIVMTTSIFAMAKDLRPQATRYRPSDFTFIGRFASNPRVLIVAANSGIASIEDAKRKSVTLAAQSKASISYYHPAMANAFLGTRFKLVTGYNGSGGQLQALERGEVAGTTDGWFALVSTKRHLLKENKIKVIAQLGLVPLPDLKGVPLLLDLVKNPRDRAALEYVTVPSEMGASYMTLKAVPGDRIAAFRKAFDAVIADPAFIAEVRKRNFPYAPMPGPEIETMVMKQAEATPDVVAHVRETIGAK